MHLPVCFLAFKVAVGNIPASSTHGNSPHNTLTAAVAAWKLILSKNNSMTFSFRGKYKITFVFNHGFHSYICIIGLRIVLLAVDNFTGVSNRVITYSFLLIPLAFNHWFHSYVWFICLRIVLLAVDIFTGVSNKVIT